MRFTRNIFSSWNVVKACTQWELNNKKQLKLSKCTSKHNNSKPLMEASGRRDIPVKHGVFYVHKNSAEVVKSVILADPLTYIIHNT